MTYYVLVSIGCLECHHASDVLGIFTSDEVAEEAAIQHQKIYQPRFSTDYDLKIFHVENLDTLFAPKYKAFHTVYDLNTDDSFRYRLPS